VVVGAGDDVAVLDACSHIRCRSVPTRQLGATARTGERDQRLYDWLLVDPHPEPNPDTESDRPGHLLLVRHSISHPDELAYYICQAALPVPLAELVRVAGSR
jgi:hypothetical protein